MQVTKGSLYKNIRKLNNNKKQALQNICLHNQEQDIVGNNGAIFWKGELRIQLRRTYSSQPQ